MKVEVLFVVAIIGITISLILFAIPTIPTRDYSLEVDAINDPETIFINARVILTNNGKQQLENIVVDFGSSKTIIQTMRPGEKLILSPPEGSNLKVVRITANNDIDIRKEYRSPTKLPGMIGS